LDEEEKHYCLPPDKLKAFIPTSTPYGVEIHNLVHSSHILKLLDWKPFLAVTRFHLAKEITTVLLLEIGISDRSDISSAECKYYEHAARIHQTWRIGTRKTSHHAIMKTSVHVNALQENGIGYK
jgi:hypothetical protein